MKENHKKKLTTLIKSIESTNGNNFSLYEGAAGQAIVLFLLSLHCKDKSLSDKASALLDAIADNIAKPGDLNFANGLAGIGWAVEWVDTNDFLKIDTNEVLEDMDTILYRSVVFSEENKLSLAEGLIGKLFYFWSRHVTRNIANDRLKGVFIEECLVLLTDNLQNKFTGDEGLLNRQKISSNDMFLLGHSLYILSIILPSRVNIATVETTLYECIKYTDRILPESTSDKYYDTSALLFLAACYALAGINHQYQYWQMQASKFINDITGQSKSLYTEVEIAQLLLTNLRPERITLFRTPVVIDLFENMLKNQQSKYSNLILPLVLMI